MHKYFFSPRLLSPMPQNARRSLPPPAAARSSDEAAADYSLEKSSSSPTSSSSSSSSRRSSPPSPARLLLFSVAGIAAATGTAVGRWILAETGEVVLLFSSNSRSTDHRGASCVTALVDDIDAELSSTGYCHSPRCAAEEDVEGGDVLGRAGEILLSISSSPHLRSVPILLLFLSSTAFVIGVVLTHGEMRKFLARMQKWKECGLGFSRQLADFVGVANADVSSAGGTNGRARLGGELCGRAEGVMDRMDGMVLDDVLRQLVRTGAEFSMGAFGGILLYSVPDDLFVGPFPDARSARRHLIRAADPSLERMLFRPGGVWDVLPRNLTEFLTKNRIAAGHVDAEADMSNIVGRRDGNGKALVVSSERTGGDDSTYDGDDSLDSPMVSQLSSGSNRDDGPLVMSGEGLGVKMSRLSHDECSREDEEDEMCATTTNSVIVHDIMVTGCLGGELQTQQFTEKGEKQIPPPPELHLRQILHRTSIAAGFFFLCHICRSPSTRRAWGYAANLLTSLGLASTAVGAGIVSALLSSNNITAINPILEIVYVKVLEGSTVSRAHSNLERMFKRVREDIKSNKRLQSSLAFFVLYWIRSLTKKGGRHSCNVVIK